MVHVEFPRYGYHSLQCCQRTSALSWWLLLLLLLLLFWRGRGFNVIQTCHWYITPSLFPVTTCNKTHQFPFSCLMLMSWRSEVQTHFVMYNTSAWPKQESLLLNHTFFPLLNLSVSFLAPCYLPLLIRTFSLSSFPPSLHINIRHSTVSSFRISLATSFNIEHHLVFFLGHDEDWAMLLTAPYF